MYTGIQVPELTCRIKNASLKIQFHWDNAVPNPLIRNHSMPGIGSLTFNITQDIELFQPENRELHCINYESYFRVLSDACNGLFDYFRYKLQNPFIRSFNSGNIDQWIWIDETGNHLYSEPERAMLAEFPGYPFSFGKPGHGSRPLKRSEEPELTSAIEGKAKFDVVDQLRAQAQEALFEKNSRLVVLLLAISSEVAIKTTFFEHGTAAGEAFDFLQEKRHVEVSPVELINNVALHAFGESFREINQTAYDSINHIFQARNKVAHKGIAVFRDTKKKLTEVREEHLLKWWKDSADLIDWLKKIRETNRLNQ